MKNVLFLLMLAGSGCTKDYVCECTRVDNANQTHVTRDPFNVKPDEAKARCEKMEETSQSFTITCTLK